MSTLPKIIQGKFKILYNRRVGPDCFRMAILASGIAQEARPGQFVHLRCHNGLEPLLRRPFSLHRLKQNNFEILYKVVGRGTNLLSKRRKADTIDVLGPLGNGFDILRNTEYPPSPRLRRAGGIRNTIVVAGGMGVAPLLALAQELGKAKKSNNILVLLGAKNKKQIVCAGDFKQLGVRIQVATDDGSRGFKGLVSDLLKRILRTTHNAQRTTIYACGPKQMLQEVARISKSLRIAAQGSLEEKMACALGACLGCAVETKNGYRLVCKDGPVFDLQEIKW